MKDIFRNCSNYRSEYRLFAIAVNIFFIFSIISIYQWIMHALSMKSGTIEWGIFELLTNYEAGFIRRGLFGQFLFWLSEYSHINIRILIPTFSILSWIFVLSFIIYKFKKYGIRWWLIPIIGFGLLGSVIRKDFIIYTLFIGLLYVYKSNRAVALRLSVMTAISVIMLLSYEPSFFFCLGFTALLVLRDDCLPLSARIAYPSILCLTILILLKSTGCEAIGHNIYASWQRIDPNLPVISDTVINSLDWSVRDSIRYNIDQLMPEFNMLFILKYIFILVVTPYIYITYMYVDTYTPSRGFPYGSPIYTTLYLFFMVCMLPMWAGLSCDYGRMLYHATLSSLCVAFIIPEHITRSTFPRWTLKIGESIDRAFRKIPRSVYSITLLMLLITPAYSFFYIPDYSPRNDSLLIRVLIDMNDLLRILISHIFN